MSTRRFRVIDLKTGKPPDLDRPVCPVRLDAGRRALGADSGWDAA